MKTLCLHLAKLSVLVMCLVLMTPCVAYGIDLMSTGARSSITAQGNSVLTATEIQPSSQRTGVLSKASDEHWFTFSVNRPGKFEVDFDGDYSTATNMYSDEWEIRLLTADNENVYTTRYAASTLNSRKIITTGLAAGKYYLVVTSSSIYQSVVVGLNYKFNTTFAESDSWEQELNNLVVTPNSINLDKAYYGTLSAANDEDWFKLVLPKTCKISLTFDGDYSNSSSIYGNYWRVSLRDKDNLELTKATYTANTLAAKEIIALDLPAGTYYLKVAASSIYQSVVVGLTYSFKVQGLQNIDAAKVAGIASKVYTGKALEQTPTVEVDGKMLVAGTDYTLTYANNVKAGIATMTIKGKGAYIGTKRVTFTIAKANVKNATAAKVKAQKYRKGRPVKPSLKLTYEGKKLKKGVDYTLKYKNNKKRGTARIIIKGKGNFKGSKTIKFKIK